MGGVEHMVFTFGSFKQVEFNKPGFVFEIGGSGFPNFLEISFVAFDNFKPVHGNVMTHAPKV